MLKIIVWTAVVLLLGIGTFAIVYETKPSQTIVEQYGQLRVEGSQLLNEHGDPVQLKGMSSHGLQWFSMIVNDDSLQWLRDDWGITVFRAAMYTEQSGYIRNPRMKDKVQEIVDAAIDLGIYVIIDWHILGDGDPNKHKEEAKEFFREMAEMYGEYPNVIYEIANEPNGDQVTWDGQIKPYAEAIIPEIRKIDPDNIIIVGTGTWSQDVDDAADNPLAFDNTMYTVHFYAGTHGQWLRDRIDYAADKGLAVFVTEWGTSESSGNGGPYIKEAMEWLDYLDSHKISWANWSFANKDEVSAAIVPIPEAGLFGGWGEEDLTESGRFVRERILSGQ